MKEKSKKYELQSENKEFPEKVSVRIQESRVISFDVYFQKVMSRNKNVQAHHKAPMRAYAERKGFKDTTEEQFEEIFRSY